MTAKEQKAVLEQDLTKDRLVALQLLRNPLDALRNVYHARINFEDKLKEAKKRNEDAQRRHIELLNEYTKELLEKQYIAKKLETARKVGSELLAHSKQMQQMNDQVVQREKCAKDVLDRVRNMAEKDHSREKKESTLSSALSSETSGEPCVTKPGKDLAAITEKMFGAGLMEEE